MTFQPNLELSQKREIRLRLRWIALLAGKTPLSLVASGGVEGVQEILKYLLAGADAVQTTSALLRHGPEHLARLVKGLTEWTQGHGATSVAEVRGRMSADRLEDSGVLVRAHQTTALLL